MAQGTTPPLAQPSRQQQKGAALKPLDIHLLIPFPPGWIHSTPRKRSPWDVAQEGKHQILTPNQLKGSELQQLAAPVCDSAKTPQLPSFTAQEGRHQPLHPKGFFLLPPLTLLSQLLTLLGVFKINQIKMRWDEGIYPYRFFFFLQSKSASLPLFLPWS